MQFLKGCEATGTVSIVHGDCKLSVFLQDNLAVHTKCFNVHTPLNELDHFQKSII